MDEDAVSAYITGTLEGVAVVTVSGDSFFFYDPAGTDPADRMFPFATLVTGDRHDRASDLDRPGVFRLNVGVRQETYRSLFGDPPAAPGAAGVVDTGHDFTLMDRIMPHPVYASMGWVCVLNPSETTFRTVQPLLAEAHEIAVRRYHRRVDRG